MLFYWLTPTYLAEVVAVAQADTKAYGEGNYRENQTTAHGHSQLSIAPTAIHSTWLSKASTESPNRGGEGQA